MGLVALVDDGSGGTETLPDAFAVLLGHGAQVFPQLVQFLEFLEGFHHVLFLGEGFRLLAVSGLGFQVFLEVQVPEFAVDVHQVVELGDIQLISVIDIPEILLGNRADFPPAVLDVTELGESVLHVSGLLHEGFEFLDHGLLPGEILFPLGILFLVEFCALFLIFHIESLETGLDGGKGADGAALHGDGGLFRRGVLIGLVNGGVLAGFGLLLGEALIEGGLDGLRLLGPLHAVFAFG